MNRMRTALMIVALSLFSFLLGRNLSPSDWFPFMYVGSEILLGLVACAAGVLYGGAVGYLCSRTVGRAAHIPVALFVVGCALLLANEAYWTLGGLSARLHDIAFVLSAFSAIAVLLAGRLRDWLDSHSAVGHAVLAGLAFLVGSQFGIVIINTDFVDVFIPDALVSTPVATAIVGASFGLLATAVFAGDSSSVGRSVAAYVLGVAFFSASARGMFIPVPSGPFDSLDWALTTLPPAFSAMVLYAGLRVFETRFRADERTAMPVQLVDQADGQKV